MKKICAGGDLAFCGWMLSAVWKAIKAPAKADSVSGVLYALRRKV
jgi:hypothetical protein